ncbi:MAG: erythromycin esterase family protein [Bacteroidia bacterium]|nr:erythromycin esterase family protein [Bacteroidia bacterium]
MINIIKGLVILTVAGSLKTSGQISDSVSISGFAHNIIHITGDNFDDLNFLKAEIQNKRIVLLGESSHTISDYYLLKTKIIKFLHQQCHFDVLAMECGMADTYTTSLQFDTITSSQMMKDVLYANQSCNEMKPLFEYMKNATKKRLQFYGFDSQDHGSSLSFIKSLLQPHYGNTADSLVNNLQKYNQTATLAWQTDKRPVTMLADTILSSAIQLINMLQTVKSNLLDEGKITMMHFKFLERSLINHKEALNINWENENPLERRDSLMAENIFWLANEIFPDKKIIIWGHNTHIDKGGTDAINKSMGYYIHKKLKTDAYHIGLYAKSGSLFWWWTKDIRTFNNIQANDIENISDLFPVTFISVSNKYKLLNTPLMGYEAEFGRKVSFVPAKRYDAIINFRNVRAVSY